MFPEFVVDELHKTVKVTALLVFERQALKEQISDPRFPAAHPAPDVNAALEIAIRLAREQSLEQTLRRGLR